MKEKSIEILNICTEAGRIMLENGAEVFRVEDTLIRIAGYYGITDAEFFVLTNGILSSATDKDGASSGRVKFIPSNKPCLSKVIAINQLSREICEGKYTVEETKEELLRIDHMNEEPGVIIVAATALASASFTFLYNGTFKDALLTFFSGLLLSLFSLFLSKVKANKVITNVFGSALVSAFCLLFYTLGLGSNMNAMIAGAIIPLIPGVSFVNGIRDIAKGDYLSGMVRLLDSLFVFLSIAVGVGFVLALYSRIRGGLYL